MEAILESLLLFLGDMFGREWIEIAAVILGFINVFLIIKRSLWNYPFGIAMVILYGWIFWDYKLYAESALQGYFLVIQIFGWSWWLRGRDQDGLVAVERTSRQQALISLCAALFLAGGLGTVLHLYTDSTLPFGDATVAALSVIAQYLMAQRRLESWAVWITVDLLSISIYLTKGLYPTALLYGLFLAMATIGLLSWRSAYQRNEMVKA
jgi:nicotinamide mononucleotide transporter